MFQVLLIYIIWRQKKLNILRHRGSFIMMKTLSPHMQTNNGVSTNMCIVYVAPVQNKAGIQNDTFHGEFIRPRSALS
jgi:hypothetical protein